MEISNHDTLALSSIASLSAASVNTKTPAHILADYGIAYLDQLAGLLADEKSKKNVFKLLQIPKAQQKSFLETLGIEAAKNNTVDYPELVPLKSGAAKPRKVAKKKFKKAEAFFEAFADAQLAAVSTADGVMPDTSAINLAGKLPPVRWQGSRGTCVAFAATDVNNFAFLVKTGRMPNLSVQYLFSEIKKYEGNMLCKSFLKSALQIIAKKGQCSENVWAYNGNAPCIQDQGAPSDVDEKALEFRNAGISLLGGDIVGKLKQVLSGNRIAAYAFPIYQSWYNSLDTRRTGRLFLPLPGDQPLKDGDGQITGHAVSIVGYQDQSDMPGGGFFIVRNSWGPTLWGKDSVFGPGHGTVPYAFVQQYIWELVTI